MPSEAASTSRPPAPQPPAPAPPPALAVRGVEKIYEGRVRALKGVDITVGHGDFFALLGPNGAGKSTLIGIVSSLVNKSAGKVSVYGFDLDEQPRVVRSLLGIVPQEVNFNVFETPWQIVSNQAGLYGMRAGPAATATEEALRRLDLWDKRDERARALSGGMKRRLMIARALVHGPRLLILDEPTAGVDIELRRLMWQSLTELNEAGTTIILTTHYLEEAESLCRNIAIIDRGEVIEDTGMATLLDKLHVETFLLDLAEPCDADIALEGFGVRCKNAETLEVDVVKPRTVTDMFNALHGAGIKVESMRNKANRLEEMFVRLIDQPEAAE